MDAMQGPGCDMAEPISDQTAYVFKICPLSYWRAAEATDAYSGSPWQDPTDTLALDTSSSPYVLTNCP